MKKIPFFFLYKGKWYETEIETVKGLPKCPICGKVYSWAWFEHHLINHMKEKA